MIHYSILYPPILPISIPAFELNPVAGANWKLYFEPSIGNKIEDFKGGFIRVRKTESDISIFAGDASTNYLYDVVPFRNPFAEYEDPFGNTSLNEIQPPGYPVDMPRVEKDLSGNYFITVPHTIFNISSGDINKRFKAQIMLTSDWISCDDEDGSGVVYFYNKDTSAYQPLDKYSYFGGNLVEKGLSEWSRVSLIAPVSEAIYELIFDKKTENHEGINLINSPIFEFVGRQIIEFENDNNYLKSYRINIFSVREKEKESLIDSSGWIVGQENPNLEIRWQNQMELDDKTEYIMELQIQTIWELRKTFTFNIETAFAPSIFRGDVKAINDHDKARVKIILTAESPLTWGPKENFSIDADGDPSFLKNSGDVKIEQGIDMTTKNGAFSGEMIVKGITPIEHWKEDDTKYFFKISGPELSNHNMYQEEYLMYAHSFPLGKVPENGVYEEDIIINPVFKSPGGAKTFRSYLDVTGAIATEETDRPSSHNFVFLRDDLNLAWKVTVSDDGVFVTKRAPDYDTQSDVEERDVYLYEPHRQILSPLSIDENGILALNGRAITNFVLGENVKPMYTNEFRFVKRVWGMQLGRKKLLFTQTYKAYMNDFNKKLGNWVQITPFSSYYIYFTSTKGQLFMYVSDLLAKENGRNHIDRYNLRGSEISDLPTSSLFAITDGVDSGFAPILNENKKPIDYAISIDEQGTLVADTGYIGISTSKFDRIVEKGENGNGK